MPKHTRGSAKTSLDAIKKTKALRKRNPEIVVGFATAEVEGGKPSVVVTRQPNRAKNDIANYGVTKPTGSGLKNISHGFAWYEGGMIMLSLNRGSFSAASRIIKEFYKEQGQGTQTCKRADTDVSEDQINRIEATADLDDLYENASAEEDDISDAAGNDAPAPDGEADQPRAAASDPDPAPQNAPETQDQPEPQDAPPAPEALSETQIRQTQDSAEKVSTVVCKSLARILRDQAPDIPQMTQMLGNRFQGKLAALTADKRQALMETGPARLMMDAARRAALGWTARTDLSEVLDHYEPELPVMSREVANNFIDIGTHVLRKAGKTKNISRKLIEQRISGFFDDGGDHASKLASVERLTKALLPTLADPDRLEQMFGVTPPKRLDDISPAARYAADIHAAREEAMRQVRVCRDGWQQELQNEEDHLSDDDERQFTDVMDQIRQRTDAFVTGAQPLAQRLESGEAVPAAEIASLRDSARKLKQDIIEASATLDASPVAPTKIGGLYGDLVDDLLRDLAPAA